uniref:Uncharacterized protein n=1 Tax=Meloidogyne enterolobii TaxID=390850 RepID=A0A6V7U796_MELEN|nr:unnamed protein product [Meloidogyne enterolobii]
MAYNPGSIIEPTSKDYFQDKISRSPNIQHNTVQKTFKNSGVKFSGKIFSKNYLR